MAAKTTVTHADGTVSTRTSKTRIYTHAVEVSPAPAAAYAAWLTRRADKSAALADAFRAAATEAKVTVKSRGFRTSNDLVGYQATLAGTGGYIYTWCSADGRTEDHRTGGAIVGVVSYLVRSALGMADTYQKAAEKARTQAHTVLMTGTPVGDYGIVRWSSRADLAAKALSEFDHHAAQGSTVRVVPVDN
jgi:hypothetical protein